MSGSHCGHKLCTVLYCWNAVIVGLNAIHCVDICLCFSVCLVMGHSLVKEVLPNVYENLHF